MDGTKHYNVRIDGASTYDVVMDISFLIEHFEMHV